MQKELENLIKEAIIFKYNLPYEHIEKAIYSTQKDVCFVNNDPKKISEIIYNGIVEFANNEFKIDYSNLVLEQKRALKKSIRYNHEADDDAKQKYGFYGEVLLHLILKVYMETEVFISKGYFYSPLERSEAKGYDVFHLMERNSGLELWFGESKFYVNYQTALNKVLNNLENAISDNYFDRNLLAILTEKDNATYIPPLIDSVFKEWDKNPDINLGTEIAKYNIKLVYPVFIAFDKKTKSYDEVIQGCINHLKEEYSKRKIACSPSFKFSLFFIFLPLDKVKEIKGDVIEWITESKPLI